MAISDAYATPQEYRAITGNTDTSDDPLIQRHLVTCSRLFDRETGQFFGRDATAVSRIFNARWSDRLDLTYEGGCPGIATIDSPNVPIIKVDTDADGSFADETAWSGTDYRLEPLQAAQGPEARPWTVIRAIGSKRFSGLVQVTAVFGWPSVPSAVRDDVIELCGIWRSENPRATGRMDELDQVVTTSPMALSLVKRIRDAYLAEVTF